MKRKLKAENEINAQHPTPNAQHPTSNIQHSTTNARLQRCEPARVSNTLRGVVVCRVCPATCRCAPRAYQLSETAAIRETEYWKTGAVQRAKSDPRQITPKGSRRQLYSSEGSVEKAVGESAGRSYREADMRGAVRGTRVQHNPKSSSCRSVPRRSDGHARKRQGTPREIRPTPRKGEASRKANPKEGGSQQRA